MTPLLADIVGLLGSAVFIAGFAYANLSASMNKLVFNGLNLIGAILLLVSLSVNFNLAAVVLETVWGCIALIGLIAALRARSKSV